MSTTLFSDRERATSDPLRFRSPEKPVGEDYDFVLPSPRTPAKSLDLAGNDSDATEDNDVPEPEIGPLVRLSHGQMSDRRFKILQQWEGTVSAVDRDSIWADLCDLTDESQPDEVVEFPIEEISKADRSILRPGSVFYWIIGYEESPGGQIRRVSEIRVRRNANWTTRQVDSVIEKGKALFHQLSANDEDSSKSQ